jgi:NAD(P)-dependent dehydrogenase (short-subunit alcohol dehydrogenase family)
MGPQTFPKQHQDQFPGHEKEMHPKPLVKAEWYRGSGKLDGKVALITGGDSGIGRSVAILFAREEASVVINYLNEHEDARDTKMMVEEEGRPCHLIAGDVGQEEFCHRLVEETVQTFGRLDIVVNNAGYQQRQDDLTQVTEEELEKTFRTNIYSFFFVAKHALPHLRDGSTIINNASINAYKGNDSLLAYSSTKGAIVAFTRSLSKSVVGKGIRVNAVAPGPIWTPFIPSSTSAEQVEQFGKQVPMGRAGQPEEVSPAFVFLASRDSSYITGQVIHPNGGEIVNA